MFIFEKYSFNKETKIAKFDYTIEKKTTNELNQTDKKVYDFTEELDFSQINFSKKFLDWSKNSEKLLNNLLLFLHLILWSSYYKLTCEKWIRVKSWTLKKAQWHFFDRLYKRGLWEFFYNNQIDFRWLVNFPYNKFSDFKKVENEFSKDKVLVPFWWWKDSSALVAMLEEEWIDYELFTLWDYEICNEVAAKFWKKPIVVKRKLSNNLIELNKSDNFYNWHVPISSIYWSIWLFVAAAWWFNNIALANESSANEPNTIWNWMEINHQWTKSLEFESRFSEFIEDNITNIKYFSFLRPYNEEKITEIFLEKCEKVFDTFSSCNRNFIQNSTKDEIKNKLLSKKTEKYTWPKKEKPEPKVRIKKWCCNCPKCAFVFVMFAAKMWVEKTVKILWKDMFLNSDMNQTFMELAWFWDKKPFECVWTFNEVQDAFRQIIKTEKGFSSDWRNFLNKIKNFLEDENNEKNLEKWEKIFWKNFVPEKFLPILEKNF